MMEFLVHSFSSLFNMVVPFLVLLGVLIFIHELGHLIAAKYVGVRVETFSLGFGKKILSYKYGDTVYCLSLFPLGGYVKMFGDDPSSDIPESEKKYSFLHKSILSRVVVVLAGPVMNLVLGAFIFFLLAVFGEFLPSPVLGDIHLNTDAYQAGFRSGDRIQKINQIETKTWVQVQNFVKKNKEKPLTFTVQRQGEKGEIKSIQATPISARNTDISSFKKTVGKIKGLSPFSALPVVGLTPSKTSLAFQAGFRNFDRVISINGKEIRYLRELKNTLQALSSASTLTFKVRNEIPPSLKEIFHPSSSHPPASSSDHHHVIDPKMGEKERTIVIHLREKAHLEQGVSFDTLGLKSMDLVLSSVVKDSPAEKAGLKAGDVILAVNNQPLHRWFELSDAIQKYDPETKTPLSIRVLRGQEEQSYSVIPKYQNTLQKEATYAAQEKKYVLGVTHIDMRILAPPSWVKEKNLFKAGVYGWQQAFNTSLAIAAHIVALIQNKISPRNVAGVITIGRYANRYFEAGLAAFLKLMALFSINLFLINLLPIPVLDGGHILLFTIEAVKGSPLSLKKMELIQQIGFSLLLLLMALTLFNDILNLFHPI